MAVYTDVAADELAELLSHYEIGELLSYKGIAEGVENSNFLLHTTAGYFILTLYEKRVAKGDLPFFLGLMTHLAPGTQQKASPRGPPAVLSRPDDASRLARHRLSAAGEEQKRRSPECAGRPARGDHQFPGRHLAAQAQRRALCRRRASAGENASGRT